jgi:hypothetical protein
MKAIKHSSILSFQKLAIVAAFMLTASSVFSQQNAEIRNVDFSLQNNQLVITYDIAKAKSSEMFSISLLIKSKSGSILYPKSLSGDFGDNISGGSGKKVIWDVLKDNAYLDDDISVEITAIPNKRITTTGKPIGNTSVGICVLKSVVFPGWGNYSINKKKTNWLIGTAAYGCAVGAFVLNRMNISKYDSYLSQYDVETRNSDYNSIKTQHAISIGLLAAAGTIWLTDIVCTWVQASKYKKKNITGTLPQRNYSMGMYYDPAYKAPSLSFKYSF